MTALIHRVRVPQRLVVGVAVLAVVVAVGYLLLGGQSKSGTAYFREVHSIYPGDAVRVLGLKVGQIDRVTPAGNQVRVDFHYDRRYSLPAEVRAAIMSPTLVATRFIQLAPAYKSGPALADGGVIPVQRTAVPVEFDELKKQLTELDDALGPNGVNQSGALNRALTAIDNNGRGQGQNFHDMLVQLSQAAKTLSDGRQDMFGTVGNLAHFSSALNGMNDQIVEFDNLLADVSGLLDSDQDALREMLPAVDRGAAAARQIVADHGGQLTDAIKQASTISRALAEERASIAQILHVGPNALTNWLNLFRPDTQTLTGSLAAGELGYAGSNGDFICEAMAQAGAMNAQQAQQTCVKYLGPVFQHLRMMAPPVEVQPPGMVPGGGHLPSYGDPETGQADTNPYPTGSNYSDIPPASSEGGSQPTSGNGLFGLMGGGHR
jgi:phospholipid/cholesterol/gamma-HCH transport system substrate-binding protein